ncbi:MAG: ABC transporter ATP-binding protein [Anaerolineales bacterium]
MNDTTLIQISKLTKIFKEKSALDQISLSINQGELFGLVGPDGAGKTTLLRILAGLLSISEGDVFINDIDLKKNAEANKSKIGYMAQEFSLYGKLSVIENLKFFGDLYDVSLIEQNERIPGLLEFANLEEFQDRRAEHLSGGMKKKLALASTLLHRPSILLLDEPTTGVDPISRREFWNILNELHIQGTTIIVSTPYMDEADRCSRVGLMYQGTIVVCDTPANIRGNVGADVIKIISTDWQKAREVLGSLSDIQEIQSYGEALHVLVNSASKQKQTIKKALLKNQIELIEFREITPRMEEAFISLIRKMRRSN